MFFTLNKKQNENKLSNKRLRKSIRLKGYDYAQSGLYFMTIYYHRMINRCAKVGNGEMESNEFGQIAHDGWMRTPKIRDNVSLGTFGIMSNHMHGIICLSHGMNVILEWAFSIRLYGQRKIIGFIIFSCQWV